MSTMSLKEICKATNLSETTLRIYIVHPLFRKIKRFRAYGKTYFANVTEQNIKDLKNYRETIKNLKCY